MAVREGAWDCPSCAHKGNRGPDKHCVACGAPRGTNVEFYLPSDAREVTEQAELARAEAGPDWTCTYCQGDNRGDSRFCGNCGASEDGAPPRPVTELPDFVEAEQAAPATSGLGCLKGVALACLALLLLVGLGLWVAAPRRAQLTVVGHEWERSIQTASSRMVPEQAWEGEVPAGARFRSSHREFHHNDQVPDGFTTKTRTKQVQAGTKKVKTGTKNMGNGYFKDVFTDQPVFKDVTETYKEPRYRDVPVYRMKVDYEVRRWMRARELKDSGSDLNPRWPPVLLQRREREEGRQEVYRVIFSDEKNNKYAYPVAQETAWRSFPVGSRYPAKVSGSQVVEVLH